MKKCLKCNKEKQLHNFSKNKTTKDKLHRYCKECMLTNNKIYYKDNKEKYYKYYLKQIKWFIDLKKELKCERCGFNHPAALDFHHKDINKKDFNISLNKKSKSKEEILKEIEKCSVLCSNCHRIEHATHYNKII